MGLFSSKKKTVVGTAVQRVLEDDALPGSILSGVTKNLFSEGNGDQMLEHILDELASGIGMRANQMQRYARSRYVHGIPQSSVITSLSAQSTYKNVLDAEMGGEVTLDYYHFGKLNLFHLGWVLLQQNHQYNPATNKLGSLSTELNTPVYLLDMQLVVRDSTLTELQNGSLEQWDIASGGENVLRDTTPTALAKSITPVPFVVDSAAVNDYLKVTYQYQIEVTKQIPSTIVPSGFIVVTEKEIKQGTFNVSLASADDVPDYHHAKFHYSDQVQYRLYAHDSGTYPTVDAAFVTEYDNLGTFFPWVYFRYDKTPGNVNTDAPAYKQSKQLTRYLGMDYDDVCEAIHENPDIADVEQAMMVMAVPADTSNELEQRYLFDFFTAMETIVGSVTYPTEQGILKNLQLLTSEKGIIIQDRQFKMALNWTQMIRRKIKSVDAAVGSHSSGWDVAQVTVTGEDMAGQPVPWSTDEKSHWYRRQITDVLAEEIRIYNLEMTYYVEGQYTTTGDENDKILLIPIDRAITDTYSIPDREMLLARSLHYVFNSLQIVKIKWYQRGAFKWLMVIVAIVVAIYSWGTSIKGVLAALAAGTITVQAVALLVVKFIIKYLAAQLALRLFVKAVGPKVAFVIAIIAAIAGTYQAIQAGSLTGAPWAKELLSLSSGLTGQIGNEIQKDMLDLESDYNAFQKEMEAQTKLLEETKALLDSNTHLAPLIIFGESPDDFYQRTVHSGNIGIVGIESTSVYVDSMLALPKFNDLVGDFV